MNEQQQTAIVPDTHPALAGHFPGRPIVPGVVIVECVLAAVSRRGQRLAAIPHLKFLQPLLPNQPFRICWSQHEGQLRFRCETDQALLAQGALLLVDDAG
ncbi:MAG TPA: hypothetical protein VIR56_05665 [Solimonas sp.]